MIFVIDNLKYDTDKMEKIANVKKWYKSDSWVLQGLTGEELGYVYDCELWKSKKGRWLITRETDAKHYAEAIDEEDAKALLLRYDLEKYEELYGEVEEA